MTFSGRTPESVLPRSDSKNPATTCKGLTANGRPCRRALASTPRSSPVPSPSRDGRGVLAVLGEHDAAAFYCWQHKDQAESLASLPEQKTHLYPLKERSSIDTLADRVGVLDLDEEVAGARRKRHSRRGDEPRIKKRDTLPSGWNAMPEPLMTLPEEVAASRPPRRKEYTYGRSSTKLSWACCLQADDDDLPPRGHHRHSHAPSARPSVRPYNSPSPMEVPSAPLSGEIRRKRVASSPAMLQQPSTPTKLHPASAQRPSPSPANSNSQTQTLLSLIPSALSPQTTSLLLAELTKPISKVDEDGYIYIFWLTPETFDSVPDDDAATSLLDSDDEDDDQARGTPTRPPRPSFNASARQKSATLQRYASVRRPSASSAVQREQRTILLKIGRAANVHRRLSQWTKQCGQNITIVRYYPYRTAGSRSPTGGANKVPHVHRVERLIHIELAEKRVLENKCDACGKEHKEWFEIEATRKGLREVDACVKRWVAWAHGQDGSLMQQSPSPVQRASPARSHAARNAGGADLGGYY